MRFHCGPPPPVPDFQPVAAALGWGITRVQLCAGGDVTRILLIIAQVPGAAKLRNQGCNTFWK